MSTFTAPNEPTPGANPNPRATSETIVNPPGTNWGGVVAAFALGMLGLIVIVAMVLGYMYLTSHVATAADSKLKKGREENSRLRSDMRGLVDPASNEAGSEAPSMADLKARVDAAEAEAKSERDKRLAAENTRKAVIDEAAKYKSDLESAKTSNQTTGSPMLTVDKFGQMMLVTVETFGKIQEKVAVKANAPVLSGLDTLAQGQIQMKKELLEKQDKLIDTMTKVLEVIKPGSTSSVSATQSSAAPSSAPIQGNGVGCTCHNNPTQQQVVCGPDCSCNCHHRTAAPAPEVRTEVRTVYKTKWRTRTKVKVVEKPVFIEKSKREIPVCDDDDDAPTFEAAPLIEAPRARRLVSMVQPRVVQAPIGSSWGYINNRNRMGGYSVGPAGMYPNPGLPPQRFCPHGLPSNSGCGDCGAYFGRREARIVRVGVNFGANYVHHGGSIGGGGTTYGGGQQYGGGRQYGGGNHGGGGHTYTPPVNNPPPTMQPPVIRNPPPQRGRGFGTRN